MLGKDWSENDTYRRLSWKIPALNNFLMLDYCRKREVFSQASRAKLISVNHNLAQQLDR